MPTTIEHEQYISADSIHELAAMRADERSISEAILRARERTIEQTGFSEQPIDALSTGQFVLQTEEKFGLDSAERAEAYQGLFTDCIRLLGEWRRKNKPEYFRPLLHTRNAQGEFMADGRSTLSLTTNALIPTAYPEQDQRHVNERVEEVTSMRARALGGFALGQTVRCRTISECADWSIEGYKRDGKSRGGYVPEIEKVVVRDMILDSETENRWQEQIALPGTYFTHDIIQRSLLRRDVDVRDQDKTALHGNQLFATDDILDFVALLDEVASEEWCVEIFLGEHVPKGTSKNYEAFRREAIERQADLGAHAHMVADFILDLCEQDTDPATAPEIVEEFVKQLMINMAQHNPTITTEMFDQKTADGLLQVQWLQEAGRLAEASRRLEKVIAEAPGGGYCGSGSCDLVRAHLLGKQADKIKELGFDPKDTLVDKGDRRCKCGKKTVVYDLKKAQKGCTSCGTTKKY